MQGARTSLIVAVVAILIALAALGLTYSSSGARPHSPQTREFYVITPEESFNETLNGIPHYIFTPTVITVNQGDTVIIHFYNTADDTHHTFTLAQYNENVNLAPMTHQDIQFTASTAGVFQYSCTIHPTTMRGELIVLTA